VKKQILEFRVLLGIAICALGAGAFPSNSIAEDLLATVKSKGVVTVATEARMPPLEFVENGKIVGYSADMMAEIMKDLPGVKLERLDLPWQGILPGLTAKRFDYVVTSVTVTKERFPLYRFSLPVADATMAVMKRKGDSSIMKPQDISGKSVGAEAGSAMLQALQGLSSSIAASGKAAVAVKTYVDFSEAYADLAAGRTQAVVNSLPALLEAARQRPETFEVVQPTFGAKKYFAWVGRKDADSESLNAFFDAGIKKLEQSGKLAELQKKWLGEVMDLPGEPLTQPSE
jgi:polar amino acid transport system substrate-binding protein